MTAAFGTIQPDEKMLPLESIQDLIASYRERLQTGLIRLAYSPGENLYLSFKRGIVLDAAYIAPAGRQTLQPGEWQEKIQSGKETRTASIPLSPFGLLVSNLSLQAQDGRTETHSNPNQLWEYVEAKRGAEHPFLVQFNWQSSMGILFLPNHGRTPHSIFISRETVLDESGISKAFQEWSEPQCEVSAFSPEPSMDLWQEYLLKCLFADICEPTLARFEMLAGRALVEALIRLLDAFSAEREIDISIMFRKVADNEVFLSSSAAAQTYRLFLKEMLVYCSAVIGPRLLAATLREIVTALPRGEREMIGAYELLPKGYFYAYGI